MSKFSEHLRRMKERRGISLEELSEYLGDLATVSTISKWMSGMHLPDRKVLNVISEDFTDDLFSDIELKNVKALEAEREKRQ